MGTKASQYAEWIELHNFADNLIDLSGWKIVEGGSGATVVTLIGSIQANGYFLIERVTQSSPHAFADVIADVSGSFGGSGLSNTGEQLILQDSGGNAVDVVDGSSAWLNKGTASPDYKSMERINPNISGSDSNNWSSSDGIYRHGLDAKGNPINGTPRAKNSVQI